jgi:hypothetical protein
MESVNAEYELRKSIQRIYWLLVVCWAAFWLFHAGELLIVGWQSEAQIPPEWRAIVCVLLAIFVPIAAYALFFEVFYVLFFKVFPRIRSERNPSSKHVE